ncbi:MAG: RraA family protein [Hyphomicrobiales bacterium]
MPTQILTAQQPRLTKAQIDAWRAVPAAVAADQLGGRGHVDPAIRPIRPLGLEGKLIGNAVTAWCEPADYGPAHHAIAVAEPGDVLVIACNGRSDAAVIGELLSTAARLKGIAGAIVDGCVRDVATIAQWPDFHLFTRWITPRGPSSMERGIVDGPVVFGGVTVHPRDLVIGDDDGLVIVPNGLVESKLKPCLDRVHAEIGWEKQLASGQTTLEVFNVPKSLRV